MAYEAKTKETKANVEKFIDAVPDEQKRDDCRAVVQLMQKVTKAEPKMWGTSIVGFGNYHYKYASGHEGNSCLTGFSPRKQNLTLYIMPGFEQYEDLMSKLGKYKMGKMCIYIKNLSDIDITVLEKLIRNSVKHMKEKYG